MNDCDENKPTDDGSTVDATAAKKPIGDGPIITTVTSTAAVIVFDLRLVDMR